MMVTKLLNGNTVYKLEEEHIVEAVTQYLHNRYPGVKIEDKDVTLAVRVTHSPGAGTGTTIRCVAAGYREEEKL